MKPKRDARRDFLDLTPVDVAEGEPRDVPLFLRRLDEAALARELREAGLFAGLAERGYREIRVRTLFADGQHRLEVLGDDEHETLIDLRLSEETHLTESLAPRPVGLDRISALSIHWLEMQDPRAAFTAERPQLPGQRHPGLRLTRALIQRIHAWAAAWGKDAVLNVPEYFHNAVFYASVYRFLSPARHGRFEALRRDLATLGVAAASAAIDGGRVASEADGRTLEWEAAEMAAPITEPVRAYLDSPAWGRAMVAARDRARFRLRASG
jgi:hypothetical protein